MMLLLLLFYPLKSFGSIREADIGIDLMNASAIHFDNVPNIEEVRHAPVVVFDCLPANVEVTVFFDVHRLMPSKCVSAYTYPIQPPYVERSHLSEAASA